MKKKAIKPTKLKKVTKPANKVVKKKRNKTERLLCEKDELFFKNKELESIIMDMKEILAMRESKEIISRRENEQLLKQLGILEKASQVEFGAFLHTQYQALFKQHAHDIEREIQKSSDRITNDVEKLNKVSEYLTLFMNDNKGYIDKVEKKQEEAIKTISEDIRYILGIVEMIDARTHETHKLVEALHFIEIHEFQKVYPNG
jgi:uncharacterized membrane protein